MIARRKFRTKEARKRERIRLTLMFGGGTVAFLLTLWGLVYGSQMDVFRLKSIYVEAPGVLGEEQVATVISSELDKKMIGIVPKDSIFFPSHNYLSQKVQEAYPRVKDLKLKRLGLYTLRAEVEEYSPKALWCGDLVPPISENVSTDESTVNNELWGTCYLMDKDGYIYAKAPLFSENVFPRYYGSLQKAKPIGQYYINTSEFRRWQDLYHSLIEQKITPQAVLFVDDRDAELYLSNNIKVLIPRQEELVQVENRLVTVLESDEIDTDRDVLYMDLRFGNKAFIKYVEENE